MKKLLASLAIVLSLSGCGWYERQVASLTGTSEVCYGGVAYIQFTSGTTVKYNPDGTIATCQ